MEYTGEVLKIRQGSFDIQVRQKEALYYLTIHQLESKKPYRTLDGAKAAEFRVIESGDLVEYLIGKNIRFTKYQGKGKEERRYALIKLGVFRNCRE